jgi:hypothetical protein
MQDRQLHGVVVARLERDLDLVPARGQDPRECLYQLRSHMNSGASFPQTPNFSTG